ncbi:hypothetical protein OHC33_000867 [Knufia fluminis]|uniref:Secreted protein n=1 Tax=Knufia fluminis TaxID=191047 RepID=A0AAN8EKX5_9EURO|nr:hypothetical protein OHC33_000867 [Knufia fluminis]
MHFNYFTVTVALAVYIASLRSVHVSAGKMEDCKKDKTSCAHVELCYAKDLGSKCEKRVAPWGWCHNFDDLKWSDKGSSFGIEEGAKCRFYNQGMSDLCKNPYRDETTGETGHDGRRATDWIYPPGKMEFVTDVQWMTYQCQPQDSDPGETVVALCNTNQISCPPI